MKRGVHLGGSRKVGSGINVRVCRGALRFYWARYRLNPCDIFGSTTFGHFYPIYFDSKKENSGYFDFSIQIRNNPEAEVCASRITSNNIRSRKKTICCVTKKIRETLFSQSLKLVRSWTNMYWTIMSLILISLFNAKTRAECVCARVCVCVAVFEIQYWMYNIKKREKHKYLLTDANTEKTRWAWKIHLYR